MTEKKVTFEELNEAVYTAIKTVKGLLENKERIVTSLGLASLEIVGGVYEALENQLDGDNDDTAFAKVIYACSCMKRDLDTMLSKLHSFEEIQEGCEFTLCSMLSYEFIFTLLDGKTLLSALACASLVTRIGQVITYFEDSIPNKLESTPYIKVLEEIQEFVDKIYEEMNLTEFTNNIQIQEFIGGNNV